MTIRTKIAIPLLFLASVSIATYIYIIALMLHDQQEINQTYQTIQLTNSISNEVLNLYDENHHIMLQYGTIHDDRQLSRLTDNQTAILRLTSDLSGIVTAREGREYLNNFISNKEKLINSRDDYFESLGQADQKEIKLNLQKVEVFYDNGLANLMDLNSFNVTSLQTTSLLYRQLINKLIALSFVLILMTVLLIYFLYYYLKRNITSPINELSLVADNITHGQFYNDFTFESNDELGKLAKNLEKMSRVVKSQYNLMEAELLRKEIEIRRTKEFEEQKDNFLSIASHELKTPVTSLKIYNQLLMKEVKKIPSNGLENYLLKIDTQINKLTGLISELLDMSRIQKGKMSYEYKVFDMNKVIADIVEVARSTSEHNIIIKGKATKEVYGDPDRIHQVVDNLLSNAIKYSKEKSDVIVEILSKTDYLQVSVRDFGVGIEGRHHKKIFERFYRVDDAGEATYPGLGIGLYICSDIIKNHKGRIWLDSKKGHGSKFSFSIPW